MDFDKSRAYLKGPDLFQRFRVPNQGIFLRDAGLDPHTPLLVFGRSGCCRALLRYQMAYHHLAQGELAGEPYLVSF